jgi:hypothetical protein
MTNAMPNPVPECPVVGPYEQVQPVSVIMLHTMRFNVWYITKREYYM